MQNKKLKYQVTGGVILIFLGIALLLHNYINDKREEVFSSMNLALSLQENEEGAEEVDNHTVEPEVQEEKKEEIRASTENYESYVGQLEIPKIGFYRGFYSKNSSLNNVKYNIKILEVSNYPDEENGNVIIIGHSGNYSNSYFANLYQLENNDTMSIYYKGKKYTYQINNIYTDKKDGTVTVYRDETKSTLTLITCTKDDETRQTIYICELIKVE